MTNTDNTRSPSAPQEDVARAVADIDEQVFANADELTRRAEQYGSTARAHLCHTIVKHWPLLKSALSRAVSPGAAVTANAGQVVADALYSEQMKALILPAPSAAVAGYVPHSNEYQRDDVLCGKGDESAQTKVAYDLRAAESEVARLTRELAAYDKTHRQYVTDMCVGANALRTALAAAERERDEARLEATTRYSRDAEDAKAANELLDVREKQLDSLRTALARALEVADWAMSMLAVGASNTERAKHAATLAAIKEQAAPNGPPRTSGIEGDGALSPSFPAPPPSSRDVEEAVRGIGAMLRIHSNTMPCVVYQALTKNWPTLRAALEQRGSAAPDAKET